MTPRVTVSIPTYNRAGLLREAIESVLAQSIREIEVFVSDNGSVDDTPAVVASFDDPRLQYVRHEGGIDREANLSLCLRMGTAPYVTMLCDDDVMLPRNLERKARFLDDHPPVGLVDAGFHVIGPDGAILREDVNFGVSDVDTIMSGDRFIYRSFAETFRITTFTLLRRSVIGSERFEVEDEPFSDFGLFLRLARRADVAFLAEPLAALRMHPGAETVESGMADLLSGGYQSTLGGIDVDQRVKRRFLARYGHDLDDVGELRAAARRWARDALVGLIGREWVRRRRPSSTARMAASACRIEPTLPVSGRAWRGLAARAWPSR